MKLSRTLKFVTSVVLLASGIATGATAQTLSGDYTVQQQSNGRYLDAYINEQDNHVVTRNKQANDTQVWSFSHLGGIFELP